MGPARGGQKVAVVVARFGHGGGTFTRGVEDAVSTGRKAAAQHVDMREGGHDGPAARAVKALVPRHTFDLAESSRARSLVMASSAYKASKVLGAGHAVEQRHRRVTRGHDAAGLLPAQAPRQRAAVGRRAQLFKTSRRRARRQGSGAPGSGRSHCRPACGPARCGRQRARRCWAGAPRRRRRPRRAAGSAGSCRCPAGWTGVPACRVAGRLFGLLAPGKVGGARRLAQQRQLFVHAQAPGLGDGGKGAQAGGGHAVGGHGGRGFRLQDGVHGSNPYLDT
jgi:hypothetical protein